MLRCGSPLKTFSLTPYICVDLWVSTTSNNVQILFSSSLINMKYHTIQSEKLIKCHHIRAWTQYVSLGKLDLKILISTYYTKDFAWEKRPKFIRFFFLKFQNWALKVPWSITFRKQFQKNYYKYYESLVSGFLVVMGCF